MSRRGSYSHEKGVVDYLAELTAQGWKTVNLKGFSPDGIATKDNKLVAVEIITTDHNNHGKYTVSAKMGQYCMFDDVFVKKVKRMSNEDIKKEEEKIYALARKKRDEEKITEAWDKYGI